MRILLVEDDRMLADATRVALHDAFHSVDWVTDGDKALGAAKRGLYDAVILDLGLPKRDGLAVLRALRVHGGKIPVIVVTARDAVDDRVRGLDLGADDYLGKPFAASELLARLRALSRRHPGPSIPTLTSGRVTLDPATREAVNGDRRSRLSAREYALLLALLRRPGDVLSREELEERVYGHDTYVESNTVEVLIHSIRKRLGRTVIRNVRGRGWRVDGPGQPPVGEAAPRRENRGDGLPRR